MGLFDTIKVSFDLALLPNKPTWLTQEYSDKAWWQSKSIECLDGTFEIRADLTLWILEPPWTDSEKFDDPTALFGFYIKRNRLKAPVFMEAFTGTVSFYCGFEGRTPAEFEGKRHRGPWYKARMLFQRGKHIGAIECVEMHEGWELLS